MNGRNVIRLLAHIDKVSHEGKTAWNELCKGDSPARTESGMGQHQQSLQVVAEWMAWGIHTFGFLPFRPLDKNDLKPTRGHPGHKLLPQSTAQAASAPTLSCRATGGGSLYKVGFESG